MTVHHILDPESEEEEETDYEDSYEAAADIDEQEMYEDGSGSMSLDLEGSTRFAISPPNSEVSLISCTIRWVWLIWY